MQRMHDQWAAEEEAAKPLGRGSSKRVSKMGATKLSAAGSRSGGSKRLDLPADNLPVDIPSRHHKLAAHTFVQVFVHTIDACTVSVAVCYQSSCNMLHVVQVVGRNILHRAWVILAVIRGLPQPLPCFVLKDMVLQPFLACVREALGAFLAAPSKSLPAFVVEIEQEHPQRMFRRLHDSQFTPGGTAFLRTRHYSVLRILSTIYTDCTDFLACMEDLLFQMQCQFPQLHSAPGDYLDNEFHIRAREIQSLVCRYVHKAVWVCLSTGACVVIITSMNMMHSFLPGISLTDPGLHASPTGVARSCVRYVSLFQHGMYLLRVGAGTRLSWVCRIF